MAGLTGQFDCLIAGGGPAGLTAALYLARFISRAFAGACSWPTAARAARCSFAARTTTPAFPLHLHVVGDMVSDLHQISVAVGHAAVTATDIHNSLPANDR